MPTWLQTAPGHSRSFHRCSTWSEVTYRALSQSMSVSLCNVCCVTTNTYTTCAVKLWWVGVSVVFMLRYNKASTVSFLLLIDVQCTQEDSACWTLLRGWEVLGSLGATRRHRMKVIRTKSSLCSKIKVRKCYSTASLWARWQVLFFFPPAPFTQSLRTVCVVFAKLASDTSAWLKFQQDRDFSEYLITGGMDG